MSDLDRSETIRRDQVRRQKAIRIYNASKRSKRDWVEYYEAIKPLTRSSFGSNIR